MAYENKPLPVECGQTISLPYIVAYMIQCLKIKKADKILEFGDGCKLCSRFDPEDSACGGNGIEADLIEANDNHFVRCNPDILWLTNQIIY